MGYLRPSRGHGASVRVGCRCVAAGPPSRAIPNPSVSSNPNHGQADPSRGNPKMWGWPGGRQEFFRVCGETLETTGLGVVARALPEDVANNLVVALTGSLQAGKAEDDSTDVRYEEVKGAVHTALGDAQDCPELGVQGQNRQWRDRGWANEDELRQALVAGWDGEQATGPNPHPGHDLDDLILTLTTIQTDPSPSILTNPDANLDLNLALNLTAWVT